jgi:protein arginine kinase activator
MKCDRCTKVATLHVTEIEEGEVREIHLCESCSQSYIASSSPAAGSGEAQPAGMSEAEQTAVEQLVCGTCQLAFREFRRQGRLGCPDCYVAFRDELLPLLENIHGATDHTGKFPQRAPDVSRKRQELMRLQNDLRAAIAEERYEVAAELRDRIRRLEGELAEPATGADA